MLFSASSYLLLPQDPGVYEFLGTNNEVLYVGKAKDLKHRVSSYFTNKSSLHPRTRLLVSQIKKIRITIVESEFESLLLEAALIKKYLPRYNAKLTDDKAYPLIRITIKNEFPAVLTARKSDDPNSLYFGPYPDVKAMRMVLRVIRRIFPFQSVLNHPKKICLYHHLGLCPCVPAFANVIASGSEAIPSRAERTIHNEIAAPVRQPFGLELRVERLVRNDVIKNYRKTINHIIDFLDGNTKKVIKDLKKERDGYSKQEDFENAQKIQKQIDAIHVITHPTRKPFEYQTNPNLREDMRRKETEDLLQILKNHGIKFQSVRANVPLHRIECYDISNFQGKQATASMVVFTDGEKDSSQYRRFKMQIPGPNDFAMMREVLTRRLKHTEWELPSLLIVDGGKGQISSAKQVLDEKNITIPLIGLAKREEIIITSDFQEIMLPKNSPALQLMMRIRDEAHRFAITYHRKLRSKALLRSV